MSDETEDQKADYDNQNIDDDGGVPASVLDEPILDDVPPGNDEDEKQDDDAEDDK